MENKFARIFDSTDAWMEKYIYVGSRYTGIKKMPYKWMNGVDTIQRPNRMVSEYIKTQIFMPISKD